MERIEYEVMAAVELNHWWYGGMRAIAAAFLDSLYAERRNLRILDAGCGTGGNALFLRRYGQVFGLDLAMEAIELGAPRLATTLTRGSVLTLPFADNSFDLVTSFDVLYHQDVPDEAVALRETRRVLRPGGRLLIRLPAYEFLRSKHDRMVHTRRRYTVRSACEVLSNAGFVVERCSYVMSLLFPLPLTQRLLERLQPSTDEPSSAMHIPSPAINATLRWPLALEAAWLSLSGSFPFGLSVLCLAHSGKYAQVVPPRRRQ